MRWIHSAVLMALVSLMGHPGPLLATESGLEAVRKPELVRLLNGIELLAKHHDTPFAVKIYRRMHFGECSPGRPATCPEVDVYVTASAFDEAPDQNLFRLPQAKGWEFLGWRNIPKKETRAHFVTFTVKRQRPSPTPKTGWWIDTYYEIGVNPWQGYMKEIPAPTDIP